MSGNGTHRSEMDASVGMVAARLSTNTRHGAMLFKIVGPHRHRAVLGSREFWCERETTTADGRLSIRWSAFDGKILLQRDCRTLNDAKKLCRAIAGDDGPPLG
jgi:hypothetical protein